MTEALKELDTVDILGLMEALPHRYPFLMVDKLLEINGDESCIGIKNVTYNEPHFQGHFPDNPMFPGVLLIEGMAQTAGALCILAYGEGVPRYIYFMTVDKAKFRKPVVPGDTIEYHVRKERRKKTFWRFYAEARVDGEKVAEAVVGAMMMTR